MGRRGPPPKPTRQKKLEGTHRKDRAAINEVAPPPGVPERPDWLDKEACAEWDRVVPQLAALGILATVDRALLAAYCTAHSLAVDATRKYQKDGLMLKTKQGTFKHPMIKVAQEARSQARLLAAEFGLSPAGRTRISAPQSGESDEAKKKKKAEAFLFQDGRRPEVIQGGKSG